MGQGLVTTPSDFGLRATAPSHPELLDNLAIELVGHEYSTKHIVRQIVSSQTYQQASKPQSDADYARFAKANDLDPDNRWLWRANARRLTFEQQRDTWLFVAGQLDEVFGGRAKQLFGEGKNNRRTLYGLVDRQFLSGVLRIFDFANPDLHIPQRSETTVPQQALFELNHDFTASVARSLAALIQTSHPNESSEVKTIAMFRQVLGRDPSTDELKQAIEFLNQPADLVPKPREEVRDWKYGYGKFNSDNNSVEWFKELPHYTGAAWQGSPKWPDDKLGWVQLTATGGHAGNDLDHAAVRRWIAPGDGTVSIRSTVVHNVAAGDGIRAIVVHKHAAGMSKLLKNEVVHNTQKQFDFDSIAVGKGDTLDFIVHFNANLNSDQFLWSPEIKMQDKSWTAERDFAGKQPNFLNPWEQLAQVAAADQRVGLRRLRFFATYFVIHIFCQTNMNYTRRQLLTQSGMGLGALGLASLLSDEQAQAAEATLAAREPHFQPRAKRVIHFFLNGGPSHVDTFDPKPALEKYAGQPVPQNLTTERKTGAAFPSPFKFKKYGESGIEVSELFAKTAAHIDDMAIVRSMYAQVPNHEPSLMLMNCGDSVQPRPSVGAWMLYGLGTENQNLPGFVAMCPGGYPIKDAENWQSGFLPGVYQGTFVDSQHRELPKLIENIRSPHATTAMQRRQLDLLGKLNAQHQQSIRIRGWMHVSKVSSLRFVCKPKRKRRSIFRENLDTSRTCMAPACMVDRL